MIKIENLTFFYDENDKEMALDNLSLDIEKGSFVAITGSNGSGKSTLAKHLNGLLQPNKGKVLIEGMDTKDEEKIWEIRQMVGMVFQNPDNQLVSSVAEDDVAFGAENLGLPSDEIRTRVDKALKAVGMYEQRKKGAHLLSGGQKQRIAIAGILAMEPECIVLDEPTAMLDPKGRKDLLKIIEKLHKDGKTIILITHFMEEAAKADRILVMQKGKIALDGKPSFIFSLPEKLKELQLELPFAVELADRLRKDGLLLPKDIVTEEELIAALCKLKQEI